MPATEGEANPAEGRIDRIRRNFSNVGGSIPPILETLDKSDDVMCGTTIFMI